MEITAFNQLRFRASNQDQDRFDFHISRFCGLLRLERLYAIHIHRFKALPWNATWLQLQVSTTSHSDSLGWSPWETVYCVASALYLCTWTGHVTRVVLFCVVWALCTEDFVFMAFDFCQKPLDSWVKHLCYCFLCSDVCSCNDQWGCSQLPSAITIFVKLLSACVLSLLTCPFFLNTSQENAWARIFVSETMCMNLN